MWLSAEETNVLDNALITMEHLYHSGLVRIQLKRLINEESKFEIEYSINKTQSSIKEQKESEKIKFLLARSEVDDHKRQLTFCNVDLSEAMKSKKILLNEHLKLLNLVNQMYLMMVKLEMAGHPDYQLKEETLQLSDRTGQISQILSQMKDGENEDAEKLKKLVEKQTEQFYLISEETIISYKRWLHNLDEFRKLTRLLGLLSNRQVMILIILLTKSTADNQKKWKFLKKLHPKMDMSSNGNVEIQLTIQSLRHYLRSLSLLSCNLSIENIQRLYYKHQIPIGSNSESCLQYLSNFLRELLNDERELSIKGTSIKDNQQYLITLPHKDQSAEANPIDHDLDIETFSILINIFNHRLPASFQILWCSHATEEDISLFFSRIQTFPHLTFVIPDIDKMHHRLREILFNKQDMLAKSDQAHGEVYYFSREFTSRKGLRPYLITPQIRNSTIAHQKLNELFPKTNLPKPKLRVICGKAGIGEFNKHIPCEKILFVCFSSGKTHLINARYKTPRTLFISINDRLNLTALISTLLSFDSTKNDEEPTIYFNISIHAPFIELNRAFFSLFVCGTLTDRISGLTFSLPNDQHWTFFIEIPHIEKYNRSIKDNFNQILPIISLLNSNSFEEVTEKTHKLHIGSQEELVARFLKAYENQTIDQLYVENGDTEGEEPEDKKNGLQFAPLNNEEECRSQINNCMARHARELQRNRISELSFIKFLYRRVRFFNESGYYRFNDKDKCLGSRVMEQMIQEAKNLSQMNFQETNYPRIFLVYDTGFSLYLLHTDWYAVPQNLKMIFETGDPAKRSEFKNKDYFAKCLAWLLDIPYENFIEVMDEMKFILTENFTYKLFHIHERKLTKLPLIIEGHTGVGKTFLLKFYSMLLNVKLTKGSLDGNTSPRIRERMSIWLRQQIFEDPPKSPSHDPLPVNVLLRKNLGLFNTIVKKIISKLSATNDQEGRELIDLSLQDQNDDVGHLLGMQELTDDRKPPEEFASTDDEIDDDALDYIQSTLSRHRYGNGALQFIWKTVINIAYCTDLKIYRTLNKLLYEHITFQIINYPLIEISSHLRKLLDPKDLKESPLNSIKLFDEYLLHTNTKSLFYRLLLHPGITEKQLEDFMKPICQLAEEIPTVELVVFFDEVNTASCLGLFKEMFMDGTIHGNNLPENIFFTAAINPPSREPKNEKAVHRSDYLVHQLPQALEHLKVSYSILQSNILKDYISKKIATFSLSGEQPTPLDAYIQMMLTECILTAQEFCEKFLGK